MGNRIRRVRVTVSRVALTDTASNVQHVVHRCRASVLAHTLAPQRKPVGRHLSFRITRRNRCPIACSSQAYLVTSPVTLGAATFKAGYIVRGSVRDLKKGEKVGTPTLAKHGADVSRLEFVALDLNSDTGWNEAMQDVRYLQHIASPLVWVMPRDKNDLIRPAVEGATRALEAAFTAKVERVVSPRRCRA